MKLRNLMYATMIACAFASCSKDDVVDNAGGQQLDGKTTIEVNANVTATKVTDSDITSLTLVVADKAGKIEAIESATNGDAGAKSRKVEVTPGQKQVMMFANVTIAAKVGDNLSAITAEKNSIASEVDGTLSMNSAVYNVEIVANKKNYLGYNGITDATKNYLPGAPVDGVKLYRNVAKVVLTTIKVVEELGAGNTQYPNAKLDVKSVYITNAKATTLLVPNDYSEWGATQDTEAAWAGGVVTTAENGAKFKLAAITEANSTYVQDYNDKLISAMGGSVVPTTFDKSFYVYENFNTLSSKEAAKTLLVVKGDFSYDKWDATENNVSRVTEKNRYYTIAIGRTGFDEAAVKGFVIPTDFTALRGAAAGINGAAATKGLDVLRNLQYNISLSVKGLGYKTPGGEGDSQVLDVQVQVVPFGTVKQDVEI